MNNCQHTADGVRSLRIERRAVLRAALISIALVPVLAASFTILLAAALSIPDAPIMRNIARDAPLLRDARTYAFNGKKIDVGTECIGLGLGLGGARDTPPLEKAIRAPTVFTCPALLRFVKGGAIGHTGESGDYTHYWHGYGVISRPFLALFPYHDLRMATFYGMAAATAFLAFGLTRRFGARFTIAVFAPFCFVNFAGFFVLWTKAAGWLVMLIVANAIVRRPVEKPPPYLTFFLAGAFSAYVDMLTTPLLVFAFPAALYLCLAIREQRAPARAQFELLALFGAFWTLGYGGLWFSKIAIASMTTTPAAWAEFGHTAAFRISGDYESVKHFLGAATLENLEAFKGLWGGLAILTFFVTPFVTRDRRRRVAALAHTAPGLLAIAVAPFFWYEALSNHSQIHGLFTHTLLALTFLPFSLTLFRADEAIE